MQRIKEGNDAKYTSGTVNFRTQQDHPFRVHEKPDRPLTHEGDHKHEAGVEFNSMLIRFASFMAYSNKRL